MNYRRNDGELIVAAEQNFKEKDYWLNQLAGQLENTCFPRDFSRGEKEIRSRVVEFRFGSGLFSALTKLCGGSDYALNAVLTAGLALLLHKYTGSNDIIVGSPIYKQEDGGDFINTVLALRTRLQENMTFKDLLLLVRQTLSEAVENQDYPIEILARQLDISSTGGAGEFPLFDAAVLLENIHDREYIRGIETGVLFSFLRGENAISVKIEFDELSYSSATIERIAAHYEFLLAAALAAPGEKIAALDLVPEEEKKRLLFDFNDTGRDYPEHKTVHELFAEQAERTPDSIAVVDVPAGPVFFTYRQLHREADSLAQRLMRQGVASETIVALLVERSLEMVVAMLAILKAGGGYLPIDTGYPLERKYFMLKDSHAPLLLTCTEQQEAVRQLELPGLNVIFIDRVEKNREETDAFMKDDAVPLHEQEVTSSLAYIMYTSGSTGIPKGVMVEHKNVVRLVKNTDYVELACETRILQTGAPVFDAATFEVWGALLNGGGLCLVDIEVILDARKLGNALYQNKINTLWLSSPLFNQLMQKDSRIFSLLRYLLVGGDVLSPRHIEMARKQHPGLKVINGYGPTENTTFSTTFLIDKDFTGNIPIGSPIANSTAYILDNSRHMLPIGVFGELYVGGDGVSRGYLNSPELTAEKFVQFDRINRSYKSYRTYKTGEGAAHPPSENSAAQPSPVTGHQSAVTLYRTGDRCRWLPDGNIEFAGRIDHQVKIRGFRVELGEIEARLAAFPSVEEAVVLVRSDETAEKYLCAYVVAKKDREESDALSPAVLREYLSGLLPAYSIPSFFVMLDKIPLNRNGKVDRRALPQPQPRDMQATYVTPRTELEKMISEAWKEALEVEKVGIYDNFFDLGGNSLKIIKVNNLLEERLKGMNKDIPALSIFSYPTIADMTRYLDEQGVDTAAALPDAEPAAERAETISNGRSRLRSRLKKSQSD